MNNNKTFDYLANEFLKFGYILEKSPMLTKYRCYRKDGMFGTIYSESIVGLLDGIERHFDSFKR
jgi:hypothetical protein